MGIVRVQHRQRMDMGGHWNKADRRSTFCGVRARLVALTVALLAAGPALAQDGQPPSQAESESQADPQPQAQSPQPPAFQPGFLDALGRWLGNSKATLDEGIKGTTGVAKDAAEAAGQATGVILGLPGTRVVNGRTRCGVATNGAADCTEAANALCRSKGFAAGKGLDINTAQKCPAWVWLSGRPAPDGVCTTETFVLRAVCR